MRTYILILSTICFTGIVNAQKVIRGTVFNDSIPLAAASIQIKNTTEGVATDSNGNFEIEARVGDILSIAYIGLNSKELVIDSKNNIIISLEGAYALDEVVVLGYEIFIKSTHKTRCNTVTVTRCGTTCETILNRSNDFSEQQLIYPNPSSSGIFNLNLIQDYKIVQVNISDINGRKMNARSYSYPNKRLQIDLTQHTSGIYIINIVADGKRLPAQKVIRK